MYLKIITQIQITPTSKSTENKPIKTFRKVLYNYLYYLS